MFSIITQALSIVPCRTVLGKCLVDERMSVASRRESESLRKLLRTVSVTLRKISCFKKARSPLKPSGISHRIGLCYRRTLCPPPRQMSSIAELFRFLKGKNARGAGKLPLGTQERR